MFVVKRNLNNIVITPLCILYIFYLTNIQYVYKIVLRFFLTFYFDVVGNL